VQSWFNSEKNTVKFPSLCIGDSHGTVLEFNINHFNSIKKVKVWHYCFCKPTLIKRK